MATQFKLETAHRPVVIVRVASPEFDEMKGVLFKRYPHQEWATFLRFGWRKTNDALVLTLAGCDPPVQGDLDDSVGHVAITEPYSLRTALASEHHPFCVCAAHSHPRGNFPQPSVIDDDMDGYYAGYFEGFTQGRPYLSLIVSEIDGRVVMSGRVHWNGIWRNVDRIIGENASIDTWATRTEVLRGTASSERNARLAAAFGSEAISRLRGATVAVIGAGGTGSTAIEVLARAGVGRLIVVDPDYMEASNLERVHGSRPIDAKRGVPKARLAREHVLTIDPRINVQALIGVLPQSEVIDAVVTADVALGCTDQQYSRLALSDLATRYLVPSIDCAVLLEGTNGRITAQVAQLARFLPHDPCPWCRGMIIPANIAQELMSPSERTIRQEAAASAVERGELPDPYWHDQPQLNTVGYHTTMVGAMAAGYAIGWLTGRFTPPFSRLQMNLVAPLLDVTDVDTPPRPDCACRRIRGWADQGKADAFITPPDHWPTVKII